MPLLIDRTERTTAAGDAAPVLRFAGSLDASTRDQAQRALGAAASARPKTIVLDLAGLEFIDSSGISTLIHAKNELTKTGCRVVVTNPQKQIKKVFEIVKALPGVAIFDSAAELDAYLAKIQKEALERDE